MSFMKHTSLLLLAFACLVAAFQGPRGNPVANPKAVVVYGNARFTVLTSRLLRLEYSPSGNFSDVATTAIINRYTSTVPVFSSRVDSSGTLILKTADLVLQYSNTTGATAPFNANNLQITVQLSNGAVTWAPGMVDSGNLLGTLRTLDRANGSLQLNCSLQARADLYCTYGLVSKNGWTVVDDTLSPLLRYDRQWQLWPIGEASPDQQDWYFLGYGNQFKKALGDFTSILSGNIPLPPRYMFGIFFSRYWAYSDMDFRDLIQQYEDHQVPLDVLVTDMDWHETFYKEAAEGQKDQAGQPPGWTGYTWDSRLFPDPKGFLDFCKSRNLRNTLNIHPASGVQPNELLYPEMARAMGINPASQTYVPFDITNTSFADNLQDIMLRPLNDQGIDFWWLDWQQWNYTDITDLNPTFWLNHVFFTNFQRWKLQDRPAILHRWGGLGNHRYQIGFSGDVVPSWASLDFQVYFTATAANVGFAYWSHDIGGHTLPSPPELYTRWVQWGIFSPAFRPHCTKSPLNDRRIWVYPLENFEIMRSAIQLRSQLLPYIYTAARHTHDTGVASLVRPMYYDYPDNSNSYVYLNQYIFGSDILSAPVTTPMTEITQLSSKDIWLPQGQWIEWFSGEALEGSDIPVHRNFSLSEIPVYVKAGSILPYLPMSQKPLFGSAQSPPAALGLMVFPGATQGETKIYDDAGDTIAYLSGEFAWTSVTYQQLSSTQLSLTVNPVQGSYTGMSESLSYEVKFLGVWAPTSVTLGGTVIPYTPNTDGTVTGWRYDGLQLALIITIAQPLPRSNGMTVVVTMPQSVNDDILVSGIQRGIARAQAVKVLLDYQWGTGVYQEDYPNVIQAAQTGVRMSAQPSTVVTELTNFSKLYLAAIHDVTTMSSLSAEVQQQALAQLTNINL